MRSTPLSTDLRQLHVELCGVFTLGAGLSPAACRDIAAALALMARKADALEARAAEADEVEDELIAVAHDLDRVAGDEPQPSFQAALKMQQRVLQAKLDSTPAAGRLDRVSFGKTLAELAEPFGSSNVVTFPVVPRPAISRVDCQGDGGEAA